VIDAANLFLGYPLAHVCQRGKTDLPVRMFPADLLDQVLEGEDFPDGNGMNPEKRLVAFPKGQPCPQSFPEKQAFLPEQLQFDEIDGDRNQQGQEKEEGV